MKNTRIALIVASTVSFWNARAEAQQRPEGKAPSLPEETAADAVAEDEVPDLQAEVEVLKQKLERSEMERRSESSRLSLNGYVDFGFFAPRGNHGVGWIRDVGNTAYPEMNRYSWTFLGDILGTPVNSRGEAADLGDAPGADRYDSVDSNGAPGFIVNELNIRVGYQLAERALLRTSVNFAPRTARQDFSLGDAFDVDIAELEYVLTEDGGTSIFVGKTMPVFGIEYKDHKSDHRFGVTPSLVDRYTSGPQLGLKVRSKLLHDWIIVAAAVSNNSSTIEAFHFYSEVDRNPGKTVSGRLAISFPVGSLLPALGGHRLEIGGSGEWGPQDRATDDVGKTWFVGGDLQYLAANFTLKAQVMRGKSAGEEMGIWKLNLRDSGFAELDWQFLPFLGAMARADLRNADVFLGMERAYLTRQMRFTGGLRVVFNPRIIMKLEYLHNREFGKTPQFDNDIFTSSLVLAY